MGILLICVGVLILGIVGWRVADRLDWNSCCFNIVFGLAICLIMCGIIGTVVTTIGLIPGATYSEYADLLQDRQAVVALAKDYYNIDKAAAEKAVNNFNNKLQYNKEEPFLIKGLVDKHIKEIPYIELEEWETK